MDKIWDEKEYRKNGGIGKTVYGTAFIDGKTYSVKTIYDACGNVVETYVTEKVLGIF